MNEINSIPRLLKAAEVAEVLRVSRAHVYAMVASGELPAVRFSGQSVRVVEEDLNRFINDRRKNGSAGHSPIAEMDHD
jgi:excisionase family DNA binding protein